jgi:hypothetical protein
MAAIRVLTDRGMELFRNYILEVKDDPQKPPPISRLSQKPWSSEFSTHIEVESLSVTTRIQLGKYLVELFQVQGVDRRDILNNPGMWSWLALLWFDNLCPVQSDGARKVLETSHYVCSSHYTDYYRHLVAASWDIYYLHREISRLFLWTPLYIHNDFVEQLASRQNIITKKALIEVFDHLYWDPKSDRPKSGAQNRDKPGNFRRLQLFIQQVELTYDLHTMSVGEIIALLPSEYDSWKGSY